MKALFLIASLLVSTKPVPEHTYHYSNHKYRFAVAFPFPAIEHPYTPTPKGLVRAHSVIAASLTTNETIVYSAIIAEPRQAIMEKYGKRVVEYAAYGFAREVKGKVVSNKSVIASYPANDFSVVSNGLTYECRALLVRSRVYVLVVAYTHNAILPTMPEDFFPTFEALK